MIPNAVTFAVIVPRVAAARALVEMCPIEMTDATWRDYSSNWAPMMGTVYIKIVLNSFFSEVCWREWPRWRRGDLSVLILVVVRG
jgi:hypothetical protein